MSMEQVHRGTAAVAKPIGHQYIVEEYLIVQEMDLYIWMADVER